MVYFRVDETERDQGATSWDIGYANLMQKADSAASCTWAIGRAVPMTEAKAALQETGVQEARERKLSMVTVMLLTIAMNMYARLSIGEVMGKIARGLRFVWPNPDYVVPKDSAIAYRRYQLGARPLVNLFHRVCRPMATPETPGAFLFGLRVMAIDGTAEDVPDTLANVAAFGRHTGGRGDSAFPQIQGVYLPNVAPMRLWMLASGLVTPVNGWEDFGCCARWKRAC
jgi:hypothetical protein